jgi:hypothetical protein
MAFVRKIAAGIGVMMLLLLAAYCVFKVDVYLFRKRADQLKEKVERFATEGGSAEEAKHLAWAYDYSELKPCSFTQCVYQVQVVNAPWRLWFFQRNKFIADVMLHAGYMPSRALAYIAIREGRVTAASYRFTTGRSDGTSLIAGTDSRSSLEPYFSASRTAESAPDLYIHRPGGCTFCEAVYADITPGAREDERAIAYSYDLTCVTRLGGCNDLAELVPEMEHARQLQYRDQHPVSQCDADTLERFGRDFGTVLLVTATHFVRRSEGRVQLPVRVEKVLKSPLRTKLPQSLSIEVEPDARVNQDIHANSRWLAFFATDDLRPTELVPAIEFKCTLIAASGEMVEAAQRGIQRSRRSMDYFGYMP